MGQASISKATAYAVIKQAGGIAKAVGYAVLSTEVNVSISKALAYAVLEDAPPGKAEIAKIVGYEVLTVPPGPNLAKVVVYEILSTEVTVCISKVVAYEVLAPLEESAGGRPFIHMFF